MKRRAPFKSIKSVRQPRPDAFFQRALVNRVSHRDVLIDETDGSDEDALFVGLAARLFAG